MPSDCGQRAQPTEVDHDALEAAERATAQVVGVHAVRNRDAQRVDDDRRGVGSTDRDRDPLHGASPALHAGEPADREREDRGEHELEARAHRRDLERDAPVDVADAGLAHEVGAGQDRDALRGRREQPPQVFRRRFAEVLLAGDDDDRGEHEAEPLRLLHDACPCLRDLKPPHTAMPAMTRINQANGGSAPTSMLSLWAIALSVTPEGIASGWVTSVEPWVVRTTSWTAMNEVNLVSRLYSRPSFVTASLFLSWL